MLKEFSECRPGLDLDLLFVLGYFFSPWPNPILFSPFLLPLLLMKKFGNRNMHSL